MPGWDADPNLEAANIIAYSFGFTLPVDQSVGQYSVDASADKVQNFISKGDTLNFGVRFDTSVFPE